MEFRTTIINGWYVETFCLIPDGLDQVISLPSAFPKFSSLQFTGFRYVIPNSQNSIDWDWDWDWDWVGLAHE